MHYISIYFVLRVSFSGCTPLVSYTSRNYKELISIRVFLLLLPNTPTVLDYFSYKSVYIAALISFNYYGSCKLLIHAELEPPTRGAPTGRPTTAPKDTQTN